MQEEPDSPQALSLRIAITEAGNSVNQDYQLQFSDTRLLHYASSHSQSHEVNLPRNFNKEEDCQISPAWEATIHKVTTLKVKPLSGSETAAVRP
jgi:hypothetical protein